MLNSLSYVKRLEEAGIPRSEAEAHMQILGEILETNLATRQDVRDLSQRIDMVQLQMVNEVRSLENKLVQTEQRMVIKLGALIATIVPIAIGVMAAIVKLMS